MKTWISRLRREPVATIGAGVIVCQNVLGTLETHFSAYANVANTVLVLIGTLVARAKVTPVTNKEDITNVH